MVDAERYARFVEQFYCNMSKSRYFNGIIYSLSLPLVAVMLQVMLQLEIRFLIEYF